MRLQKFLARAGVASRRSSENLMTAGRVTVNGEVVSELGAKVDPLVDVVAVDGREVAFANAPVTIMLNKPAGVITTMKAQSDRPIVAGLVPTDRYPGLYPIGRLDADTTGILLFSTDGQLGNNLLHPSRHVPKTYVAQLKFPLSKGAAEALRAGVQLDDGPAQPAEVEIVPDDELPFGQSKAKTSARGRSGSSQEGRASRPSGKLVRITVHEGRYHQVKRMFEAVGNRVVRLHRESFGPLVLGDLQPGAWRELTAAEVQALSD